MPCRCKACPREIAKERQPPAPRSESESGRTPASIHTGALRRRGGFRATSFRAALVRPEVTPAAATGFPVLSVAPAGRSDRSSHRCKARLILRTSEATLDPFCRADLSAVLPLMARSPDLREEFRETPA